MKLLKKLGLGFLGFITLLIAVSFLLPAKSHVERSLVIKASAEPVFAQVNNLKNWEKWSPWHKLDPKMKLTYEGPESGAGAKYSWTSDMDEVGNGSLTIKESKLNEAIVSEMNFGDMGISYGSYKFEPVDGGTKITWSMDSDCSDMPWKWYVPSKYFNLFMDELCGKDFEKGLNNLKTIVESQPATPAYTVEEKKVEAMHVLTIKATCTQEEISQKLGELYGEMVMNMQKNKLEYAGHPFAIYHKYDPKAIELEAGIAINKPGKSSGRIVAKEMKAGPVAMISHFGPYEGTYNAHMHMDKWLKDNNKSVSGSPWEVYITDPGVEKDPNKWLTEVYYPL
jgi:effector-binding domain-containing protein